MISQPGKLPVGAAPGDRMVDLGWRKPLITALTIAKDCFAASNQLSDMWLQLETAPPKYSSDRNISTLSVISKDVWSPNATTTPYTIIAVPGKFNFTDSPNGIKPVNPATAGGKLDGSQIIPVFVNSQVALQCVAESANATLSVAWELAMYMIAFNVPILRTYWLKGLRIDGISEVSPTKDLAGKFVVSLITSFDWQVTQKLQDTALPMRDVELAASAGT